MNPLQTDEPMTQRQRQIRNLFHDHRIKHGRPPTRRELMGAVGSASRSYIDRVIAKLKTQGELG